MQYGLALPTDFAKPKGFNIISMYFCICVYEMRCLLHLNKELLIVNSVIESSIIVRNYLLNRHL